MFCAFLFTNVVDNNYGTQQAFSMHIEDWTSTSMFFHKIITDLVNCLEFPQNLDFRRTSTKQHWLYFTRAINSCSYSDYVKV